MAAYATVDCTQWNFPRNIKSSAHYLRKYITLSAEESLIKQALMVARTRNTTLTAAFREWLERYVSQSGGAAAVEALMA
jgi:hypothetical protein